MNGSKYQKRIADVLVVLMKSAPSYAVDKITAYRNKRFNTTIDWLPEILPFWCTKLPRAAQPINTCCLYALLSGLITANVHFSQTNENEIKILTLIKTVEKVAGMKWWTVKLVGDYKRGYTFAGLTGI